MSYLDVPKDDLAVRTTGWGRQHKYQKIRLIQGFGCAVGKEGIIPGMDFKAFWNRHRIINSRLPASAISGCLVFPSH